MCLIRAVPDNDGDFVAPARVFNPKSTSNRSSYYSQTSSNRHYATSEHSPRRSAAYTVPPPPTHGTRLAVPAPRIIQEVAPRSASYTVPPPPVTQLLHQQQPVESPLVLPSSLQASPRISYPPAVTTHTTTVREPSRSHSTRSVVPPPVPDAPPAVRDPRHSRDPSRSSAVSTRGRPESRQSSAPRTPHTPPPPQLSPRAPRRHPSSSSTSRSHRSDDLGSNSSRRSHRTSHSHRNSRTAGRPDRQSPELLQRSASQRSTRLLEEPRYKESIVIQNGDGTRVRQFYYD